jgi:hypothetical protein
LVENHFTCGIEKISRIYTKIRRRVKVGLHNEELEENSAIGAAERFVLENIWMTSLENYLKVRSSNTYRLKCWQLKSVTT